MPRPEKEMTLCFLVRQTETGREVALAAKKPNQDQGGQWSYENGYGGKVEASQTLEQAALDEVQKESTVVAVPEDLRYHGYIDFHVHKELFGEGKGLDFRCHMYLLEKWQGEPQETSEMGPPRWYPVNNIPFDRMWPADRHWVEEVVACGMNVYGEVYFKPEKTTISLGFRNSNPDLIK
ncbi:NUDIX domain-containing protein [Candidatus Woesearchaeota archaeon]|nr:NUDIX domain-containing protein [Candidatus Woesearchaeota archaeon]